MKKAVSLGLDIGTSFCCAALARTVDGSQITEIVPSQLGSSHLTSSIIGFTGPDNTPLVGELAKNKQTEPGCCARTFYDFKRVIGRKYNDNQLCKIIGSWGFVLSESADPVKKQQRLPVYVVELSNGVLREYTAFDLYTILTQHLIELAVARLAESEQLTCIAVTVPAHFNSEQRVSTKESVIAAVKACISFEVSVHILDEPVASVRSYVQQARIDLSNLQPNKFIMVFDLGGGTLDVTLLKKDLQSQSLVVCNSEGLSDLGGTDFDHNIMTFVTAEYKKMTRRTLNKQEKVELRRNCEAAKIALSFQTTANISVCGATTILLSREKFEELIKKDLRRSTELVWKLLKPSDVKPEDITDVVLVGGGSRVPAVLKTLKEFFGSHPVNLRTDVNPTECCAMGAAIFAHTMAQQPSAIIAKRPVAEAVTKNNNMVNVAVVLNSSIGFRIGATGNMHVVLSKNTSLPCEHQMRIYPAKRGQNKVTVKAFRGEHQLADENTPLGAISIDIVNDEALFLSYRVTEEGIMLISLRDGFGITVNERLQILV
jgi:molecular chaperone DnaK (HSP70)